MTALETVQETAETVADLLEQLGGIAPGRVRLNPPPGTATEADLIAVSLWDDRLCELVDGVLVEKVLSYPESILAGLLGSVLRHVPAGEGIERRLQHRGVHLLLRGNPRLAEQLVNRRHGIA